jgi:3-dehydroquinate synthase
MATTIRVALNERSYDIEIGRGNLSETASFLSSRLKCTHAVVIADENVRELHSERVCQSLTASGIRTDVLAVPPGEASKSVAEAARLWQELARLRAAALWAT